MVVFILLKVCHLGGAVKGFVNELIYLTSIYWHLKRKIDLASSNMINDKIL